jgi:hypothetical protein
MVKSWKDMTAEQKLESNRQMIEGISARLDEVGGVVIELEKQIRNCKVNYASPADLAPSSSLIIKIKGLVIFCLAGFYQCRPDLVLFSFNIGLVALARPNRIYRHG